MPEMFRCIGLTSSVMETDVGYTTDAAWDMTSDHLEGATTRRRSSGPVSECE